MAAGHTVLGILAHVDAGKTTLTEALLYRAGAIRRQGRVDHRDTFLDAHPVERQRGITVSVSYTHLDVYKRQEEHPALAIPPPYWARLSTMDVPSSRDEAFGPPMPWHNTPPP